MCDVLVCCMIPDQLLSRCLVPQNHWLCIENHLKCCNCIALGMHSLSLTLFPSCVDISGVTRQDDFLASPSKILWEGVSGPAQWQCECYSGNSFIVIANVVCVSLKTNQKYLQIMYIFSTLINIKCLTAAVWWGTNVV